MKEQKLTWCIGGYIELAQTGHSKISTTLFAEEIKGDAAFPLDFED